jgi:hypothetical protein
MFLGKSGELRVKDFYEVGEFSGLGSMKIDAAVVYQPGQEQQRVRGVRIEIKAPGRLENTDTAFLDMDEVETLSTALAYMADAEANKKGAVSAGYVGGGVVAPPPYTEFEFRTRGDFAIGFYRKGNDTGGYASSGTVSPARVFFKAAELPKIKALVDRALAILKEK